MAGESDPVRPGVASGQISATRIIAATTQNMGLWISDFRWSICGSKVTDTASTAAPATETVVMYIHGGEPKRGTTSRVSSGFFIASSRAPGVQPDWGVPVWWILSGSVAGN